MNQQEYYYNSIDKSILSYKYTPFNPSSITINDTPDDIKICYKNRLITNPICMNVGEGSNASFDFGNFTPGAGYFIDVNADVTTKQMKLFGRKLTRQQSGEPEEWVKGFIDFSFSCFAFLNICLDFLSDIFVTVQVFIMYISDFSLNCDIL